MLKSILIGLDNTERSDGAVQLGIQWAGQTDALLVGLMVVDEEALQRAEPVPVGGAEFKRARDHALVHMAHVNVEQYLERFALHCAEARVACKLLEDSGRPHDEIAIEAQRFDLIVLAQGLRFPFTTAHEEHDGLRIVLKHTPRPVVVVPKQPRAGKNILVAYDGSLPAARALQMFVAAGLPGFNEVHVVSVHENPVEAARRGDRAIEFLRSHDMVAQLHAIESTSPPAQVLIEKIATLDAGLIVMGAYGQPALKEFMFGSVTRTLLDESPVPMFMYH
jgi:nucleotide-binding universal stress UspA family protein